MGTKSRRFLSIASTVFALTVLSKILGFFREILMGYFIGTSAITDAYNIANVIPNFFMLIVQQVIAIAFIPIFLRLFHKEDEKSANTFVSNLLFVIGVFSLIFSALVFLFSKQLVSVFAVGMTNETKDLASSMLKISCWSLFIQSFVLVLTSHLQAKKNFIIPVIAGYAIDVSAITLFFITSRFQHYYLLGFIPVVNMAIQLLLIIPASIKQGFSFRIKKPILTKEIKELFKVSIPALFSVGIYQINLLVDKNIASLITEGGISSLSYAQTLLNIFETLIMNSIVTIAYSHFSSFFSKDESENANELFYNSASKIALFTIPISIALFAFSEPIIRVVYQRGAFGETSVLLTSANLRGYAVALFPLCMTFLYTRFLYAKSNRVIPIVFSGITLFVNATLNFMSYKFSSIGISGVAWATSIANLLNFVLMAIYCSRKHGLSVTKSINNQSIILIAISTLSIVVSFLVFKTLSILINNIYINGILSGILYFVLIGLLLYLIKSEYFKYIRGFLQRKTKNNVVENE